MAAFRQESLRRVEANVRIGVGDVALVTENLGGATEHVSTDTKHILLQLLLKPSPTKGLACYPSVWGPHRFERLGTVFILPPHSSLRLLSPSQMHRSVVCQLQPALIEQWIGSDLEWTDRQLRAGLDIVSPEIRNLFQRVSIELRNPGFASEIKIELMVGMACVEIGRYLRAIDMHRPKGGLPAWRLRLIQDYVAENPGGANLSELASLCGLSVRHLARAFRANSGQSLGQFIADTRLCTARAMLLAGASVKEAAAAVGFSTPANFAAAFRRSMGCSPRQLQALDSARVAPGRRATRSLQ